MAVTIWIQADLDAWTTSRRGGSVHDWNSTSRVALAKKEIAVFAGIRFRQSTFATKVSALCLAIILSISNDSVGNAADRAPKPATKADLKRPFRENVTLPVDGNLLKQFGTVEDLLAHERWAEAIGILQEIAQTESKALVLVQPGRAGGIASYLNAATRCNVLLSRVSVNGRIAYREKVDPQAKRWFENWQQTHDEGELLRIVRQTFLSSYGDDALWALGEVAWDRGDFSAARLWWEQLIPLPDDANPENYPNVMRYPDSHIDRASILARIVLCSILAKESFRAIDELQQFADQFPLAEGWMAGQNGRLVDILRRTLNDSKRWTQTQSTTDFATFGLSPERYRHIPESIDIGAIRWSHSLPSNPLRHANNGLSFPNDPLSYYPVVYGNVALVNDANAIRGWNMLSGKPAWQSEGRDPAVIYPSVAEESTVISRQDCVGVPYYTMTIANDRLFARMGSPVSCSSISEMQREFPSDLVCLDLVREGKLVWKVSANDLIADSVPWRFEGTPVVVGGRAYVALCRRNPQLELVVACLDSSDGRLLWQRHIGAFRSNVVDSSNRVSHLLLTAGGGRIFLSTDVGAIVAIDSADGRLEWAVSYESRSEESPAALSDPSRKTLRPALFHAGLLFVAPNDSSSAYCIEADSGRLRWQFSYLQTTTDSDPRSNDTKQLRSKQWRHLLGIGPGGLSGRLIVSGNSLWAIDIETGATAWSVNESLFERNGNAAFGRGLIAGDQVMVPLRESIEIFDFKSGIHVRTVPLKVPGSVEQGGNLTLANGTLLVAQPGRLAAYREYSRLKERLEIELIQRPDDTGLQIQLADLEATDGSPDTAIDEYQRILERIGPDDPAYVVVRRRLASLFHILGSARFRDSDFVAAHDNWLRAISFADEITKQVEFICDLSRVDEMLNHPEAAVVRFQEILNREELASVRRQNEKAGDKATREISRLINERGRDVYRAIETAASAEIEVLKKSTNRTELHRFVAKYPHSKAVTDALRLLVELHRKSGETSEAYAVLNQIRQRATDDQSYVEATLVMIEMLEAANASRSAKQLWKLLSHQSATMEVEFAATRHRLAELVRSRVEQYDSELRTRPVAIERSWNSALPIDSQVIIPRGGPPSPELAAFFVCMKQKSQPNTWRWRCLDWRTGRIRWEETTSSPIKLVGWTQVHLMIGTPHGWYARTADHGRIIWEQSSLGETSPFFAIPPSESVDDLWPAFFDATQGFQLFDPNNGCRVAALKPPGVIHGISGSGNLSNSSEQIESIADSIPLEPVDRKMNPPLRFLIQTLKPARVWDVSALNPRDHWMMQEIKHGGEIWQGSPLVMKNRFVGVTSDHCLVGAEFGQSPVSVDSEYGEASRKPGRWAYRNLPFGTGSPFAFVANGELLVVVDGTQLASFDPTSGNRKWLTGLADLPLAEPERQICVADDCILAASHGMFRSILIKDGSVRFARYLGDTSPQWHTSIAWTARSEFRPSQDLSQTTSSSQTQTLVATWPLNSVENQRRIIRLCDPTTGMIVQQLRADAEPRRIELDHNGYGLLWTDLSVSGLKFSSAASIAENGAKSIQPNQ